MKKIAQTKSYLKRISASEDDSLPWPVYQLWLDLNTLSESVDPAVSQLMQAQNVSEEEKVEVKEMLLKIKNLLNPAHKLFDDYMTAPSKKS